jgi:hypothetical protein
MVTELLLSVSPLFSVLAPAPMVMLPVPSVLHSFDTFCPLTVSVNFEPMLIVIALFVYGAHPKATDALPDT